MQNITFDIMSYFRKTIPNYSDHIHLDNENYALCTTWYFLTCRQQSISYKNKKYS